MADGGASAMVSITGWLAIRRRREREDAPVVVDVPIDPNGHHAEFDAFHQVR